MTSSDLVNTAHDALFALRWRSARCVDAQLRVGPGLEKQPLTVAKRLTMTHVIAAWINASLVLHNRS
jgi:hypothetical protein